MIHIKLSFGDDKVLSGIPLSACHNDSITLIIMNRNVIT